MCGWKFIKLLVCGVGFELQNPNNLARNQLGEFSNVRFPSSVSATNMDKNRLQRMGLGRGEDEGEELHIHGLLVVLSFSISLNNTFHGVL